MDTNLREKLTELAKDRSDAIIQEPLKVIRESENASMNDSRPRLDVKEKWNSISNHFFHESGREDKYEMSLFKNQQHAEEEKAVQRALQKRAEEKVKRSYQDLVAVRIQGIGEEAAQKNQNGLPPLEDNN